MSQALVYYTEQAQRLRAEGATDEISYDVLIGEDLDTEALAALWLQAESWRLAAAAVAKTIGAELAVHLAVQRSVEVDGQVVFYKSRTRETCVDPIGFFRWLTHHPDQLVRAFNANSARKGALEPAVRDTFFEKEETGEPVLQSVPVQVLEDQKQRKKLADG